MRIKLSKQDIIFSKLIRERDKKCVFCERMDGKLECSHFWGRGNKATRFSPLNCDTLCFQCHANNEGNKQGFYREWKQAQLGSKRYVKLEKRARSTVPYGKYEKMLILVYLTNNGLDGMDGFLETLWKP